jgi:hypothetical protein
MDHEKADEIPLPGAMPCATLDDLLLAYKMLRAAQVGHHTDRHGAPMHNFHECMTCTALEKIIRTEAALRT